MMDVKRFSGVLNIDDKPQDILQPQHIAAKNGRFTGGSNGLTFQNIKGNYVIANSNLPSGDNECLGTFFDSVNQIIYWFNYNSFGNNGIYQLSVQTGAVSKVFLCGTDSTTDVLNFSLDYPVHSVAIVYRPSGEGNLLYWTDGLNRPRFLNVDTVSTLAPFTSVMLDAAKVPPLSPPSAVSYFSVSSVQGNRVRNKMFRFAYRWVYKNNFKSTFSPTSITPFPENTTYPNLDTAPNVNNAIQFSVLSGVTEDFQAIEIFAQEYNGASWGDFFLIDVVDRDTVGTPIPFIYTEVFYNNGTYSTVLPSESDLRFDWLPDKANTLELLNGNTIIYGGITEGYDKLSRNEVDVQVTTTLVSPSYPAEQSTWKWQQYQRLGMIYFDQFGKTNGVISFLGNTSLDTTNFDVTTGQYNNENASGGIYSQIPKITMTINHLPPSWATTYQVVRQNLTPPSFIQWVTNDYQVGTASDADYIFLGIQSLVEANSKNGFVPSYEFTNGDMVRIMAKFLSADNTSVYSTQLDFQILDVVQRTMNGPNPATQGAYLKLRKPNTFPTPAYSANMFIEIYTPPQGVTDSTAIFYEWGQKFNIVGGYHTGNVQDQGLTLPAVSDFLNGDVYCKARSVYAYVGATASQLQCMDRNYNDFQESAANSSSRGWPIDENAAQEYYPVTVRWGGSYVQDTKINNLNRFFPQDLDTIDRSKGDIRRFKTRDRILRVFQDRGVGQYGVYARYIQNNDSGGQLVTTDSIITANNINYYAGTYGLGGYPTNLVSTPKADYFTDVVTGRGVRLSSDGITDLGLLYKGQYYFTNLVTPYNKTLLRTNGAIAKVMGYFDLFDNEYHTILQAGTGNGTTTDNGHWSFNETRNAYCCDRYDFYPEWAISAADVTYSWKNGELYKHDSPTYCNFYGEQKSADITVVFNPNLLEKKSFNAISEVASDVWGCPVIYTNTLSYGTQRQETNLVAAEFALLENMPSAAIKRDINSIGGKINGQFLKGNYLVVKFEKLNASDLVTLSEATCRFTDSQRTDK